MLRRHGKITKLFILREQPRDPLVLSTVRFPLLGPPVLHRDERQSKGQGDLSTVACRALARISVGWSALRTSKRKRENMRVLVTVLITLLLETSMIQPVSNTQSSKQDMPTGTKNVFAHKPHAHLYWQAFLHVANNNKEHAKTIIAALQANKPETIIDSHKNNRHALDTY